MPTNVLIVEDEGLIALDLKKKLERAGYGVSAIADSADEALAAAETLMPDLVMMDIRIRGARDGIETAEEIRRRFHIPVMFVTAHADDDTLARARITEPFGYIVKPFHRVDFRPQIEMALWKHEMEQKLRESEAWLAATVGNVADALIATDRAGNIALMNEPAARLSGWDRAEAVGKPLLEVFEAFEEATGLPVVHPLEAVYDGRPVDTSLRELRLRTRGGSMAFIEAEMSANSAGGLLLGAIVVFRDTAARRKAEMEQRKIRTQNALMLMAVGFGREMESHQRRVDELLGDLVTRCKGETLRMVMEVYDCAAHQQSVIQQLILLGEKQTGPAAPLDLNGFVQSLRSEIEETLGPRRNLLLRLKPGLPKIAVDVQGLQETLFRLVGEGRESIPGGGSVEIATASWREPGRKPCVRLAVRDSGSRLRENAKDRVFDPYYQSRSGNRNSGFSLALVHQFVALSGGHIDVENAPEGGVRFLMTFPAAAEEEYVATPAIGMGAAIV